MGGIITFSDTRKISRWTERGDFKSFCDYLNEFPGENILKKFQYVLKCWDLDMSNDLSLISNGKNVKMSLYYIIEVFSEELPDIREMVDGDLKMVLKIPEKFDCMEEIFPIYQVIHTLEHEGITLELYKFNLKERIELVNKLPASFYNRILKGVVNCKDFLISIDNPSIRRDFNFISYEPYYFLQGMFAPYNTEYHRDILYHLSKKMDSNVILESTPMDIEYYIEQLSKENEQVDNTPRI